MAMSLPSVLLPTEAVKSRPTSKLKTSSSNQQLELMEPDFYTMGHLRHVRAYGISFKEGPDGVGVYAAKDMSNIERPRVILEVPMEILITVRKEPPWMFFPDIVPLGHPLFDVINDTNPENDYDLRLSYLLLLATDQEDNFWRLYSDYLPNNNESTDLLLATDEELDELQDPLLAEQVRRERESTKAAWEKAFVPDAPLKLRRLARSSDDLKWAMGIARSRSFRLKMTIGALVQEADILAPYADMLNHSFEPTCSLRWRASDCVLEVVVKVGQHIKEGDEMTLNYWLKASSREYMHRYGFSSPSNPWGTIAWSGKPSSRIHKESFFSALNVRGMPGYYYHNRSGAPEEDSGVALAAARMLPFWTDGDYPMLPSKEKQAVKELHQECNALLRSYPTTLEQDAKLLASADDNRSVRWRAALTYRLNEKRFIKRVQSTLDMYLARILY